MFRVVAVLVALLVSAPVAEAATLTVSAPKGVPATVTVGKRVLAKSPAKRSVRFKVSAGKVRAPQFSFNGVVYAARVTRTRVIYRALPAARELHATAVAQTQVTLDWTAPKHAVVALRRTVGVTPARTVRAGVKAGKVDKGLKPDSTYTYALFTKTQHGWIGPLAVTVGTASSDPAVAAYVAPPSTVILHAGDKFKATLNAKGVSVVLATGGRRRWSAPGSCCRYPPGCRRAISARSTRCRPTGAPSSSSPARSRRRSTTTTSASTSRRRGR